MGCKSFVSLGNVTKLPVNGFKWVEDIPEFDESFIKSCSKVSDEGYFLEIDVKYPK